MSTSKTLHLIYPYAPPPFFCEVPGGYHPVTVVLKYSISHSGAFYIAPNYKISLYISMLNSSKLNPPGRLTFMDKKSIIRYTFLNVSSSRSIPYCRLLVKEVIHTAICFGYRDINKKDCKNE